MLLSRQLLENDDQIALPNLFFQYLDWQKNVEKKPRIKRKLEQNSNRTEKNFLGRRRHLLGSISRLILVTALFLPPVTTIQILESVKPDAHLIPALDRAIDEDQDTKLGNDVKDNVTDFTRTYDFKPYIQPFARYWIAESAPSTQAHISRESWTRYIQFKEETCRKILDEDYMAELQLNSTESGYFHWEANEFHRQLRDRLLPQARGGSFRTLIGSHLLSRLDPRLFASEPGSFCEAKRHISEADERHKLVKEEQHMFEDFLINKVLPPDMFAPRSRPPPVMPASSNTTNNVIKF